MYNRISIKKKEKKNERQYKRVPNNRNLIQLFDVFY